jgi:hypothetical protein
MLSYQKGFFMIKFQPFITPNVPGYKSVACSMVFGELNNLETLEGQNCEFVRLMVTYNGDSRRCLFFVEPGSTPLIASINPMLAVIQGVLSYPEDFEAAIINFTQTYAVEETGHTDTSPAEESNDLLDEIKSFMEPEKPQYVPPEYLSMLLLEYESIANDKSIQQAYNCASIVKNLDGITQEDYDFISTLPCGSAKLSMFILDKLKAKIR